MGSRDEGGEDVGEDSSEAEKSESQLIKDAAHSHELQLQSQTEHRPEEQPPVTAYPASLIHNPTDRFVIPYPLHPPSPPPASCGNRM